MVGTITAQKVEAMRAVTSATIVGGNATPVGGGKPTT